MEFISSWCLDTFPVKLYYCKHTIFDNEKLLKSYYGTELSNKDRTINKHLELIKYSQIQQITWTVKPLIFF